MRLQALIAGTLGLAAGACGDDLPHPGSFPTIVDHGGRHAGSLNVVTMTYPNDSLAQTGIDFDAFVLGSQWLATVGAPYGVTGGAYLGAYVVEHDAPAAMGTEDVIADLGATVPAHADADGEQTVFMMYVPGSTALTDLSIGPLCGQAPWAFHRYENRVFAIIADCDGSPTMRTALASHELIEAATDPFLDALFADGAADDGWRYFRDNEVADLCQFERPYASEDGFSLERIWSPWAAQGPGAVPCVPVPDGSVWTYADPDRTYVQVAAGGQAEVTLRGWSSQPDAQLDLLLDVIAGSQLTPTASVDTPSLTPGGTATVTITVPDRTPSGAHAIVAVAAPQFWVPIEVEVP